MHKFTIFKLLAVILTLAISLALSYDAQAGEKEEIIIKEGNGAFLGIYPAEIDGDTREALDFKGDGVLINDVVDDGPAEKAGVEAGDILTKIEKVKIKKMKDIHEALSNHKPGDKIKVYVSRDGKDKDFKVKLDKRPPMEMAQMMPKAPMHPMGPQLMTKGIFMKGGKGGFLGVEGRTLKEQLASYFGVKEGVLIEAIVKDSPAEKAGLKAGDVIVKLGDEEIEEMDDLYEAVGDHKPEEAIEIEFYRDKKSQKVKATLAKREKSNAWFGGGDHDIIIHGDDGETFHWEWDGEGFSESLEDILENIDIEINEDTEEMRKEMEELRKEMMELKEEMKKMKN